MNETKSPWPGLRRRDDLPFIIHRSSFIIVFAVSFYIVAVVILFSRFFWSPPLSQVSLYMLLLSAICCGVAVRDPSRALTVLSLGVPLVGGMPHLAQGPCPPPLLMMIAAFAVGWLINQRRQTVNREDGASRSATYIMILLLFFLVSGALTAWRYLSYAPVGGRPMGDSVIN
ncbi:hypothetical protein FJY63_13315, partial [Candidatus Sumerlaeota bacterium]|nr:hypothetical protein [Candidatus Sumerlaeota bacterium]